MKETNYWQQFMSTGKIDDYLSYKRQNGEMKQEVEGEQPHAGTFQCNRNHIEGGTFRGI